MALDVGGRRVGIAMAHAAVRVPIALTTLDRQNDDFWSDLKQLVAKHDIEHLVVGLPRALDGQETAQTRSVRAFVDELKTHVNLPFTLQDEALTSTKAEASLRATGKPYHKADIDALAASFILSDYLVETERA